MYTVVSRKLAYTDPIATGVVSLKRLKRPLRV